MGDYLLILVVCLILGRTVRLRVLALSLIFCITTGYLITNYSDSVPLIILTTHFSVIFVSLLLLFTYSKDLYIVSIYSASLILTLISYICWQHPMLIDGSVSLLIMRYGVTAYIELGLLLILVKESYKSFRGCLLITSITFIYLHRYI